MVLTYQITRDDIVRSLWRRMFTRPHYLRSLTFLALLAVAALLLGGPANPYVGMLLACYVGFRPFALRSAILRMVDTNPTVTDRRSLTLDDAGLIAEGADWQIRVPWRHFRGWSEDPSYFYLEKSISGLGPMIPKDVMTEAEQTTLRGYLTTAALGPSARS